MPISFRPMREYMAKNNISYYKLGNEGVDAQILQRIRAHRGRFSVLSDNILKHREPSPVFRTAAP